MKGPQVHLTREDDLSPLQFTRSDAVVTLQLNRPAQGNAIDLPLATAFRDAARLIVTLKDVAAVVLAGTGGLFCAGGDVRAMVAAPDRPAFIGQLADTLHEGLLHLRAAPVPIIAAVHGPVAGGGLGLVLAADIAIAAESATFCAAYSRIGLSPDCGVTALLPRAVGMRRAAMLMLTDMTLDAARAAEWGLVSEVCADDALDARVTELASQLAQQPGRSAGETARLLRAGWERDLGQQLGDEAATVSASSADEHVTQLIGAFLRSRGAAGSSARQQPPNSEA